MGVVITTEDLQLANGMGIDLQPLQQRPAGLLGNPTANQVLSTEIAKNGLYIVHHQKALDDLTAKTDKSLMEVRSTTGTQYSALQAANVDLSNSIFHLQLLGIAGLLVAAALGACIFKLLKRITLLETAAHAAKDTGDDRH
jgi:hypothetical protein